MVNAHQLHRNFGTMTVRVALLSLLGAVSMAVAAFAIGGSSIPEGQNRTPVLVELFTSEGCSSCPPADRFLEKLDRQPVAGAEMIVLSEHVDYWNHIGWKDPYSAHLYSDRQSAYAKRFGLEGVYTPQMVVDGSSEFVGSNEGSAGKAFVKALRVPKLPIYVSSVSASSPAVMRAHVEIAALDRSFGPGTVDIYAAVALNHAESQVSAGENAGHRLTHVSVVRNLIKIGDLNTGQSFSQDVQLKLGDVKENNNLRLIVFVQEPRQGRVLGANLVSIKAP
jgi:hypothetical protein